MQELPEDDSKIMDIILLAVFLFGVGIGFIIAYLIR
jgi:hypothetical protein